MTEQVSEERWVVRSQGKNAWAEVAREVLTEVAGHYAAVITYADLAEDVQVRSGMRTRSPYVDWIDGVLASVAARCRADRLPPLTSLVVDSAEVDEATVQARLACYRHFANDVPAKVIARAEAEVRAKEAAAEEAAAARRPKSRPSRAALERQAKAVEEAPKICPTCFIQLPASGVCDACG